MSAKINSLKVIAFLIRIAGAEPILNNIHVGQIIPPITLWLRVKTKSVKILVTFHRLNVSDSVRVGLFQPILFSHRWKNKPNMQGNLSIRSNVWGLLEHGNGKNSKCCFIFNAETLARCHGKSKYLFLWVTLIVLYVARIKSFFLRVTFLHPNSTRL